MNIAPITVAVILLPVCSRQNSRRSISHRGTWPSPVRVCRRALESAPVLNRTRSAGRHPCWALALCQQILSMHCGRWFRQVAYQVAHDSFEVKSHHRNRATQQCGVVLLTRIESSEVAHLYSASFDHARLTPGQKALCSCFCVPASFRAD